MSEGKPAPAEFSKPEVITVLMQYCDSLQEEENGRRYRGHIERLRPQ
jgi:ATP sulfurylase